MRQAATHNQAIDFPTARIDGTDESIVRPFREFLESYGTRVYVNKAPPVIPDYHLVVGDPVFVKDFFADWKKDGSKRLVVALGVTPSFAKWITGSQDGKAVLLDARLPGSRVVNDIFAFFFTEKDDVLDLRSRKTEETFPENEPLPDYLARDRQRIQASIDSIFKKSPEPVKPEKSKPAVHSHKQKPVVKLMLLPMVFLVVLVIPFFWYLISFLASLATISIASWQLYSGNVQAARRVSALGQHWIGQSQWSLSVIAIPLRVVRLDDAVRGQERLLSLASEVAGSIIDMEQVSENGKNVATLLLTQAGSPDSGSGSPALAIQQLRDQLLAAENKLSLAKADLTRLLAVRPFPFSIGEVQALAVRGEQQLTKLQRSTGYLDDVLTLYPTLAGFKGKRKYLVLFQNSMELRPTGGFIGSLASVTLDEGRLSDLNIQDVYTVDGQLKGHVDPPLPIRELLNEEHWYLRDSNWDPDFSKSGARAAWFYEKETGKAVDGVIGISSPFLVDLLAATGPLDLSDYNDRITADNFFGKSLYYTQTGFFPGSTQKKDFLGSLVNALVFKLTSGRGVASPKLFTAITSALERGNLVMTFADPQEQAAVERFGWAGRLPLSNSCLSEEGRACFSDSLSIIEANLGVNKVNYYIERFIQNQISLTEDGSIETTLTLVYRNTSSAAHPSAGGGTYKAYARFYLPAEAVVTSASLDGTAVTARGLGRPVPPLPYQEVEIGSSEAKVVGIAFLVPQTSERKISLAYRQAARLRFNGNSATYNFQLGRQPGITKTTFETRIAYPIFWTPQQLSGEGTLTLLAKQGRLEYNTDASQAQTLRIKFSK